MKRLLLLLLILYRSICSWANSYNDSLIIYPKPAKNVINITKIGNDTLKFNLFLFRNDGHMVKSSLETNQIYVNDITNGEYILEIFDDKHHYRFVIHVEN